jgi:hypothetical protein
MSRIQINDLKYDESELRDLSPQELLIQGGGFGSFLRKAFRFVVAAVVLGFGSNGSMSFELPTISNDYGGGA